MSTRLLYGVIRSHSLIADLLDSQQLLSLMKADNLKIFMELLSGTPYVNKFGTSDATAITLEKAFYRTFFDRILALTDIVPKTIAEFLKAYCVKYEILNLKRVIQGKFNDIPPSQIVDSLIPIESFDDLNFQMLAETRSLDEVVARFRNTRFSILQEHMDACRTCGVIWPLELDLTQKYATTVLKSSEKLPKEARVFVEKVIGVETDLENLLIALRQRSTSQEILKLYPLADLFSVRYRIPLDILEGIIQTEDLKSFIVQLPLPYSQILTPIYEGNFLLILTRLRQHIYEVARTQRLLNDFGFNAIMAYIIFCEIEKDNLVGLAWGKAQNIPSSDVLKYLVLPQ